MNALLHLNAMRFPPFSTASRTGSLNIWKMSIVHHLRWWCEAHPPSRTGAAEPGSGEHRDPPRLTPPLMSYLLATFAGRRKKFPPNRFSKASESQVLWSNERRSNNVNSYLYEMHFNDIATLQVQQGLFPSNEVRSDYGLKPLSPTSVFDPLKLKGSDWRHRVRRPLDLTDLVYT